MIDLFIRLKTDYDVTNKIVENIVVALLNKTKNLSKVGDSRGRNPAYSTDADSADLQLVVTSDYGTDDFSPRSEGYDDVTQESDPDLTARRKVIPTICIDEDDKHTVCMEKECVPSERTVRQLKKRATRREREDRVFATHKPIVDSVAVKEEVDGDGARCSFVNSVNKCVRSCDVSDSIVVSDDEAEQLLDERAKPLTAHATTNDRSNNAKGSCKRGEVAMQTENKGQCRSGDASETCRVIPTICLEDDGSDTVRFEQESQPSERTIRKLMAKSARDGRAYGAFDAHKPFVYGAPVKDEIAKDNRDIDVCDKSFVNSVNSNVQKPNSLEDDSSSTIDDSDEHDDENELFDDLFLDTDHHDKNFDDSPGTSLVAGRGKAKQNSTHHQISSSTIANSEAKSSNKQVGTPNNSTNLSLVQTDEQTKRFKTVPIDLTADDDDNYPKSPKVEADAASNVNDKPAKRIHHEIGIFGDILEYEILNFPKNCHFDLTLDDEADDARRESDDQDITHIFNELSSLISNDVQSTRDVNVEKHTRDVENNRDNRVEEAGQNPLGFKNRDGLYEEVPAQTSLTLDSYGKERNQQMADKHQTTLVIDGEICESVHNSLDACKNQESAESCRKIEELESSVTSKDKSENIFDDDPGPKQIGCENMTQHVASGDDIPISESICKKTDIRPSTSEGNHDDLVVMPISKAFEKPKDLDLLEAICIEDEDVDMVDMVDTSPSVETCEPIGKPFGDDENIPQQEERVEGAPSTDQLLAGVNDEEEVVCDEDIGIRQDTEPKDDVTNQSEASDVDENHLIHENSTTCKSIHQVPEDRKEVPNRCEVDEELRATSETTPQAIEQIEMIDKHLEHAQVISQGPQSSETCRDNIENSTEEPDRRVQAITVHHILDNSPSLASTELSGAVLNEEVSGHRPIEKIGVIVTPEPVHAENDVLIQVPVLSEEIEIEQVCETTPTPAVELSDEYVTEKQNLKIDDIPNKELASVEDEKDFSKNFEVEKDSSEHSGDHQVERIPISYQRAELLEASRNDIEDVTEKESLEVANNVSGQLPARIEDEKYSSERPECHGVEIISMSHDVSIEELAEVEDEKDMSEHAGNRDVEKENFEHSQMNDIEIHHETAGLLRASRNDVLDVTEEGSIKILDDVTSEKFASVEDDKDFSEYSEDREIETIPILDKRASQHSTKNKDEKDISQHPGSLGTETIPIPHTAASCDNTKDVIKKYSLKTLDVTNHEHAPVENTKDLSDNPEDISEHSRDDGVEATPMSNKIAELLGTRRHDVEVVTENESLNKSSHSSTRIVVEKNISEHSGCHEFQTTPSSQNAEFVGGRSCNIEDVPDDVSRIEDEKDIIEHPESVEVENIPLSQKARLMEAGFNEEQRLKIPGDVTSQELAIAEDEKDMFEHSEDCQIGNDIFEQSVDNKVESIPIPDQRNELSGTGCNDIESEKEGISLEHSRGHKVETVALFNQDIGILGASFNDVEDFTEKQSEKIPNDVIDQEPARVEEGKDLPEHTESNEVEKDVSEHTESNEVEKDVSEHTESNEVETIPISLDHTRDENEKDKFEHDECHEIESISLLHQSAGLLGEDATKKESLKIPDDVLSQKGTRGHSAEREVVKDISEHSRDDIVDTILIPQTHQLGASCEDISRTKQEGNLHEIQHGDELTGETGIIIKHNPIEETLVNDERISQAIRTEEDIGISKVSSKTLVAGAESPRAGHDGAENVTKQLAEGLEVVVQLEAGNIVEDQSTGEYIDAIYLNQALEVLGNQPNQELMTVSDPCPVEEQSDDVLDIRQESPTMNSTHDEGVIESTSSSHGIDTHPVLNEQVVEIVLENLPTAVTDGTITLEEHVSEYGREGIEMASEHIGRDVCEDQEVQETKVIKTVKQSQELSGVVHDKDNAENIETTPIAGLSKPVHELGAVYTVEDEAISQDIKPLAGESDKLFGTVDLKILGAIHDEDGGAKSKNSVGKTLFVKLEQMTEFPGRNKSTPQSSRADSEATVYLFVHHDETNLEQNEHVYSKEQEIVADPNDKYVIDETSIDEQTPINPPAHLDIERAHHSPLVYFEDEDLRDDAIAHDLVVHNEEVVTETIFLYTDSYEKPKVDENVVQPSPSMELVPLPENNSLVLLANVAASQPLQTPSTSKPGRRRGRQPDTKEQVVGCATASRRRKPKQKYIPNAEDLANKRITRSALINSTTETLETSLPVPHDFLTSSPSLFTRTTDKHYTHKPPDVCSTSEDTNDSESSNLYIDKEKDTSNELLSVYDEDTLDEVLERRYDVRIQAPMVLSIPDGDVNEYELLDQMERMTASDGVHGTRQSLVEAVDHVVADTDRDFSNPPGVFVPRNLEFTTLFSQQVPSCPSEMLNEVAHKPFRTMAQRKEYYKLNPYVSIERLNMKSVESQKVHLRNTRSRSLDINWIRSVKLADTLTKDDGNFELDALQHDEKNARNEMASEKINIEYPKDVKENKDECDIAEVETVRENSDDNLPLASLKMKLNESSLDDDFDEVPLLERLKVKSEVSQSSIQETDIMMKVEKHQEPHDKTTLIDATPCQTTSSVTCTEPSLEIDSNSSNISKIHVDKENELKKNHSINNTLNINDMESPNWKYYTAPKLRQKSISKDSLNRLVTIQNEPTSSCTKEKLETTTSAVGNTTKTATDEKYLLLPKLRRKSLLETTEMAKDATKKKPKTVDLLTNCKNTVSPIAEKLKRKLENDKIEGVPLINDINSTPKSTRSSLRESIFEENTTSSELLESPEKALVVKQIKGPIKKNIGRFLDAENQWLKKTEDNVEEPPLTQPIFNKTFEENHETNSNDTQMLIPETPTSTKRNKSYKSETLDVAVQNLDHPISIETDIEDTVKESTQSNNILVPSTSKTGSIVTEEVSAETNTGKAMCTTEEINTNQETNDSTKTSETPNSSVVSEINVGASTAAFTSNESIAHSSKSRRSKAKAFSNFAKKISRLNLFHSHLSILNKNGSKGSKTVEYKTSSERRESTKSESQPLESNHSHKTGENSEESLHTKTKTNERYSSRSDASVEMDVESVTTSKEVKSSKPNNRNKKSLEVSESKKGSRRSRSRSSTKSESQPLESNHKHKTAENSEESLLTKTKTNERYSSRSDASVETDVESVTTSKEMNSSKPNNRNKKSLDVSEPKKGSRRSRSRSSTTDNDLEFTSKNDCTKTQVPKVPTKSGKRKRNESAKSSSFSEHVSSDSIEDLNSEIEEATSQINSSDARTEKSADTAGAIEHPIKKRPGRPKSNKPPPERNTDNCQQAVGEDLDVSKLQFETTNSTVKNNSIPKKRPGRPKSVKPPPSLDVLEDLGVTAKASSEKIRKASKKRPGRPKFVKTSPEQNLDIVLDAIEVETETISENSSETDNSKVKMSVDFSDIQTPKKRPGRPKSVKPSIDKNTADLVAEPVATDQIPPEVCKQIPKKRLSRSKSVKPLPEQNDSLSVTTDLEPKVISGTTLTQIPCKAEKIQVALDFSETHEKTRKKRPGRPKSAKPSSESNLYIGLEVADNLEITKTLEAQTIHEFTVETCKQTEKKHLGSATPTKITSDENNSNCVEDSESFNISFTTSKMAASLEAKNNEKKIQTSKKRPGRHKSAKPSIEDEAADLEAENVASDEVAPKTCKQIPKKCLNRPKSAKLPPEESDDRYSIILPDLKVTGVSNTTLPQILCEGAYLEPEKTGIPAISSETHEDAPKKRAGRPKSIKRLGEENIDDCANVVNDSGVTDTSGTTSPKAPPEDATSQLKVIKDHAIPEDYSETANKPCKKRPGRPKSIKPTLERCIGKYIDKVENLTEFIEVPAIIPEGINNNGIKISSESSELCKPTPNEYPLPEQNIESCSDLEVVKTISITQFENIDNDIVKMAEDSSEICEPIPKKRRGRPKSVRVSLEQNHDECLGDVDDLAVRITSDLTSPNKPCETNNSEAENGKGDVKSSAGSSGQRKKRSGRSKSVKLSINQNCDDRVIENLGLTVTSDHTSSNNPSETINSEAENGEDVKSSADPYGFSVERKKRSIRTKSVKLSSGQNNDDCLRVVEDLGVTMTSDLTSPNNMCEIVHLEAENGEDRIELSANSSGERRKRSGRSKSLKLSLVQNNDDCLRVVEDLGVTVTPDPISSNNPSETINSEVENGKVDVKSSAGSTGFSGERKKRSGRSKSVIVSSGENNEDCLRFNEDLEATVTSDLTSPPNKLCEIIHVEAENGEGAIKLAGNSSGKRKKRSGSVELALEPNNDDRLGIAEDLGMSVTSDLTSPNKQCESVIDAANDEDTNISTYSSGPKSVKLSLDQSNDDCFRVVDDLEVTVITDLTFTNKPCETVSLEAANDESDIKISANSSGNCKKRSGHGDRSGVVEDLGVSVTSDITVILDAANDEGDLKLSTNPSGESKKPSGASQFVKISLEQNLDGRLGVVGDLRVMATSDPSSSSKPAETPSLETVNDEGDIKLSADSSPACTERSSLSKSGELSIEQNDDNCLGDISDFEVTVTSDLTSVYKPCENINLKTDNSEDDSKLYVNSSRALKKRLGRSKSVCYQFNENLEDIKKPGRLDAANRDIKTHTSSSRPCRKRTGRAKSAKPYLKHNVTNCSQGADELVVTATSDMNYLNKLFETVTLVEGNDDGDVIIYSNTSGAHKKCLNEPNAVKQLRKQINDDSDELKALTMSDIAPSIETITFNADVHNSDINISEEFSEACKNLSDQSKSVESPLNQNDDICTEEPDESEIAVTSDSSMSNKSVETVTLDVENEGGNKQIHSDVSVIGKEALDVSESSKSLLMQNDKVVHELDMTVSSKKQVEFGIADAKTDAGNNKIASDTTGTCKKRPGRSKTVRLHLKQNDSTEDIDKLDVTASTVATESVTLDVGTIDGGFNLSADSSRLYKKRHGRSKSVKPSPKDGKCLDNADEVPKISDTALSNKRVEGAKVDAQIDEAEDSPNSINPVNQKNGDGLQDAIATDMTSSDIVLEAVSLETGNEDSGLEISADASRVGKTRPSRLKDLKVIDDTEMSVVGQHESTKSPLNDVNTNCSDMAIVVETVILDAVSGDGDDRIPQSIDQNNDSKVADNSEVTKTLSNFSRKTQSPKKRSSRHQSAKPISPDVVDTKAENIDIDNIKFFENTQKQKNHDDYSQTETVSIALDIEPSAETDVNVAENVNAKKIEAFEEASKELQNPIYSNVAEDLEVSKIPDRTSTTDIISLKSQFENSILPKDDEDIAEAFEIRETAVKKHNDNYQITEASETSTVDVDCDNISSSKMKDQSLQENDYTNIFPNNQNCLLTNNAAMQEKSIHLENNITENEGVVVKETANKKRKLDTNSSLSQFYDVLMENSTAKRNKYEEVTIDTDLVNQKVHKTHSPLAVSPGRKEKKRLESIINELKENTCIVRSEKHESLDVPTFKEKLVEKIDSDSDGAIESGRDQQLEGYLSKNDAELVSNNPQILSSESTSFPSSTDVFNSTTSTLPAEPLSTYHDRENKLPSSREPSLTMDSISKSKSNTTESETSPNDKIPQKSSTSDEQSSDLSETTETDPDSNGHSINFGNLVVSSDDSGILSKVITMTSADTLISPTTSTYSFKNDGHILREPKDPVESAEAQVNPDADLSLDFSDISPIKMFIARDGPLDLMSSNNFINDVDYPQSSRDCNHSDNNNEANDDSDHLGGPLLNGKTEDKDLFPSYNQPTNVSNVFPFTFSQLLDVGEYNEINPEEILEILDAKLEPATSHDNENAAKNLTPPAQPTAESHQIGLTNYNLAELACKLIETTDSEDNINCKESDFAPRTDTWSHFFANDCSQQKVIVIHNEQYPVAIGNDMEPYAATYMPEIHDRKDTTVLPLEAVKRSKLEGENLPQPKQKPTDKNQSARTNGHVRRSSVVDKPLTKSDDSAHVVTQKPDLTPGTVYCKIQPQPEKEPTRAVLMSNKLDQNKRPVSPNECLNIFDKIKLYKRGAKKVDAPVSVENVPAKPRARKKPGRPKNPPPEVSEPAQSPKLQIAKPKNAEKNEKYEILNTDNLLKLKMKPINRKQQNATNDSKYSTSYSMDNILKKDPADRKEADGKRGDKNNEENGLVLKRALPASDNSEPSSSKLRRVEDNHSKSNKDQLFDRLVEQGNLNSVCSLMVTEDNKLKLVRERRASFSRNNGATYERRGDTNRWGRHRNDETSRPYPATYQGHEKKYQNNNVSGSSRGRPQSQYAPASGRHSSENSSSSRGWRSYYKPTSVRTGYVPDNKGPFDKSARTAEERLSGTNDLNNDDACYKKYDNFCPVSQPYSDRNARSSQARLPAKNDNKKEDTWYKKFDDFYPSHRYAYGFDKPHRNESK